MAALDSTVAIFPTDVLECCICYNITSLTSIVLCRNGHVFCTDCRQKVTHCGVCQGIFEQRPVSNVLQKILNSVEIECKFKSLGCNQKLNLEDREKHEDLCKFRNICKFADERCKNGCLGKDLEAHEESCEYRKVLCFSMNCQSLGASISIGPMADILFNHYLSNHSNTGMVKRMKIECPMEFELSESYSKAGSVFLSTLEETHYIFVTNFGVDKLKDSSRKTCLISTKVPREAKKLKCAISMKHCKKEILNYVGKVFSIDDTINIHSMYEGGMIYPVALNDFMDKGEITFSFKISKDLTEDSN